MAVDTALDMSMEESVRIHMPWRHGLQHLSLSNSQLRYLRSPLSQDQIKLALAILYVSYDKQITNLLQERAHRELS